MNAYRTVLGVLTAVAIALVLPFTAVGEVRVGGSVVAGFGQYADEPAGGGDSVSDLIGESEANVNFTGSNGDLSYAYRLRVREADNTLAAARHQVSWNVSDAFTLDFYGRSFGLPAAGTAYGVYSIGHFGAGFVIGDLVPTSVGRFSNTTGINATFATGGMKIGLFVIADCAPACPVVAKAAGGTEVITEDMTTVLHFSGKFGAIGIGFYSASAAGVDFDSDGAGTSLDSDASETNLMVSFKTGSIGIGFEYTTYGNSDEDAGSGMALGVKAGGIGAHYVTLVEENAAGTETVNDAEVSVVYTHSINDKSNLAVGYVSRDSKLAGAEQTDTLLIASLKTNF